MGTTSGELIEDFPFNSSVKSHPNHRPVRMLIFDGPLQYAWLLQDPSVGLPIPAQRRFARAHPGLIRILAELFGCQRSNAVHDFTNPDDVSRAARNKSDCLSNRSFRPPNLPRLLCVQNQVDPR